MDWRQQSLGGKCHDRRAQESLTPLGNVDWERLVALATRAPAVKGSIGVSEGVLGGSGSHLYHFIFSKLRTISSLSRRRPL